MEPEVRVVLLTAPDEQVAARLAAAGEHYDCRMLGQLWHVGRQQLWSPIEAPVGVSGEPDAFSWTVPHKADSAQIRELVAAFVDSAVRLQRCGFSGVELGKGAAALQRNAHGVEEPR